MWIVGMLGAAAVANPYAGTPTVVKAAPFQWRVPERAVDRIELVLTVPTGHAVYRDKVGVKALRGRIGEVVFPEAELTPDLYEPGTYRASYRSDLVISVPVEAVDAGQVELELTQQGCRAGLCWPIETTTHTVSVVLVERGEERR